MYLYRIKQGKANLSKGNKDKRVQFYMEYNDEGTERGLDKLTRLRRCKSMYTSG